MKTLTKGMLRNHAVDSRHAAGNKRLPAGVWIERRRQTNPPSPLFTMAMIGWSIARIRRGSGKIPPSQTLNGLTTLGKFWETCDAHRANTPTQRAARGNKHNQLN